MTGSSLAPIIIPIVVVPALAAWLGLIWYASAHPGWKAHRVAAEAGTAGAMPRPDGQRQIMRREVTTVARRAVDAGLAAHDRGEAPSLPPRQAA